MSSDVPLLRNSERTAFKRCPAKWEWGWNQGLVPVYEKPGALWFGTGMHLALAERYKYRGLKRGKDVLKVWRDYVGDTKAVVYGEEWEKDHDDKVDALALGEAMLGGYLDHYGKDERWFVLSAEQNFNLLLPHPQVEDRAIVELLGTFDLVARDQASDDSVMLWDHKNVKAIQVNHLPLDDQAGTYWAVAADVLASRGLIEPGEKLDGILYNFLKKIMPDTRPRNAEGLATNKPLKAHYIEALGNTAVVLTGKETLATLEAYAAECHLDVFGEVSKQQPTPRFHREEVWRTRKERRTQIRRIQNDALWIDAARTRQLPIIKNPTADCSWDCPFYQMCLLHEAGDDWQTYRDQGFKKVDPYEAHRLDRDE